MKEIIATGKNIEKAIQNGLDELGVKFEDVDIEVISEGGFFSKAKVKIKVITNEELKEEVVEQQETVDSSEKIETQSKQEVVTEEKQEINEIKKENNSSEIDAEFKSQEFLKELLASANLECSVERIEEEKTIKYVISGSNLSGVIGNKGEGLNSIQYLTSLIKGENEKGKKIIIDAGDYKVERERKLRDLASRLIEKVKSSGRSEKLRPMNAYERRIVHEVVSLADGVRSESFGEEPNRYLTIYPEK